VELRRFLDDVWSSSLDVGRRLVEAEAAGDSGATEDTADTHRSETG
jgi:hypothetical protein